MNKVEPKILSGFLELLPKDQILFNNMLDTIKKVYERYGFLPLDTPVIEYSKVLLAKAGGETEQQIYRFNKGDNDLSLRFDLTVPLARFVAMHEHDLSFPFKRYQIGKVYRGERPQRGRFREFYQCDIDIIGKDELSVLNDAEIPSVIYSLFKELDFGDFIIKLNNRRILNGFFDSIDLKDVAPDILRIIDKIYKIGKDKVLEEIKDIVKDDKKLEKIDNLISLSGNNLEKIKILKDLKIDNEEFIKGVDELEKCINYAYTFGINESNIEFDITITRGLDYYTGTVYETFLKEHVDLGSVCSGGRYDNLAEYYTDTKLPGVGISIGLSRLFWQLRESNIVKENESTISKVIVIPMDESNQEYSAKVCSILRNNDINTELCTIDKSFKHKMKYANRQNIPYVIIIGEEEQNNKEVAIKNMATGEQEKVKEEKILEYFNK